MDHSAGPSTDDHPLTPAEIAAGPSTDDHPLTPAEIAGNPHQPNFAAAGPIARQRGTYLRRLKEGFFVAANGDKVVAENTAMSINPAWGDALKFFVLE